MRGFLSGISVGAVVAVLAAGGVSVMVGPMGGASDNRGADTRASESRGSDSGVTDKASSNNASSGKAALTGATPPPAKDQAGQSGQAQGAAPSSETAKPSQTATAAQGATIASANGAAGETGQDASDAAKAGAATANGAPNAAAADTAAPTTERAANTTADTGAADVPAGSAFGRDNDNATRLPAVDAGIAAGQAPDMRAPDAQTADTGGGGAIDTASAARPDVGVQTTAALDAPQAQSSQAPEGAGLAPVYPSPQSASPDAPQAEADLSISTNPAQPPAPNAAAPTSAFPAADLTQIKAPAAAQTAPSDRGGDTDTDAGAMTADAPTAPNVMAQAPVMGSTAQDGPKATTAETTAKATAKTTSKTTSETTDKTSAQTTSEVAARAEIGATATAEGAGSAKPAAPSPSASPARAAEAEVAGRMAGSETGQNTGAGAIAKAGSGADKPAAQGEMPKIADLPRIGEGENTPPDAAQKGEEIAALRPSIGKPAATIGGANSAARGRDEAAAPAAAATAQPADQTDGGDASATIPFERNAEAFDNPEGKPLMSIVLIDDGKTGLAQNGKGVMALGKFPYPISIAVDAAWKGAPEAAAAYRKAGYEVLALADLPQGASAADTEVSMSALLRQMPDAVAVMEGTGSGLQGNREMSRQLASILMATGHGLILSSKGLNSGAKFAADEGVPVATLFRDIDSEGQDARVIRRFLDHAAFKAAQDKNGVVMVGRLRADTISALHIWGQADRAARVALAPVSAVLKGAPAP